MADIKQDHKGEDTDNYGIGNNAEPKNMQELTEYVSTINSIVTFCIHISIVTLIIYVSFYIF